eukprot:m.814212 g.814212  ORF g.814212 m.814212 type:complete len:452 (+) comp59365_c0_seq13:6-1361(+)
MAIPTGSWAEVSAALTAIRSQASKSLNDAPSNIVFDDTNGFVYSLSSFQRADLRQTVMYTNTARQDGGTATMASVIDLIGGLGSVGFAQSRAEQLRAERQRATAHGITNLSAHPATRSLLFSAGPSLFSCSPLTQEMLELGSVPVLTELISSSSEARIDPQFCPANADLVAFVRNNELWVHVISTQVECQLTHAGAGLPEGTLTAGVAPYIIQEEFNRYTGFRWAPVAQTAEGSAQLTYSIVYEVVDSRDVALIRLPDFDDLSKGEEHRYPYAGKTNSKVILNIVSFTLDSNQAITNIVEHEPQQSFEKAFPWAEYLVRYDWTPNGQQVRGFGSRSEKIATRSPYRVPSPFFMRILRAGVGPAHFPRAATPSGAAVPSSLLRAKSSKSKFSRFRARRSDPHSAVRRIFVNLVECSRHLQNSAHQRRWYFHQVPLGQPGFWIPASLSLHHGS